MEFSLGQCFTMTDELRVGLGEGDSVFAQSYDRCRQNGGERVKKDRVWDRLYIILYPRSGSLQL